MFGWKRNVPQTIMMISAASKYHMVVLNCKKMVFSEKNVAIIITELSH